jgi:glycosyltransferase involved in cell wall biosynthesis
MQKKACFFSRSEKAQIQREQYLIQDINILKDLGYSVIIATKFREIPRNCDLYFSWWASGSILPFIVSSIVRKPIIIVAGGNEAMFYRDSITKRPKGYLSTPWYKKIATRITLKFSTRVLIVSEFMRNDVMKLGANNPILVHNSVNTDQFVPTDTERTEITTMFSFDRDMVELKRGYILLQAIPLVLHKYPRQIFTFIGRIGNGYDEFCNTCKELGITQNVKFMNHILNKEVVNWLQRSKLYIQISDTETFGVAIAEALSCETPVVISNRGAIPEVVGDLGIYVDHNNHKDVANGIIKILDMKEENRKIIGDKMRKRIILLFSYEKRKMEIKKIIDSIKC